jgi:hypothetical protein
MLTKKENRKIVIIGIIVSLVLVLAIIGQHRKYAKEQEELLTQQHIEAEEALKEEENKDIEKRNIPPIEKPKSRIDGSNDNIENQKKETETQEYKEEIKEVDGNKVLVKSTPVPKKVTKDTPEGIKKPVSKPKPTEPPKLEISETTTSENKEDNTKVTDKPNKDDNSKVEDNQNKENEAEESKDPLKDPEKPPTYENKEEPKKDDGVIKDLEGKPTGLKPATNVIETKASDLPAAKEGEMGKGDKF